MGYLDWIIGGLSGGVDEELELFDYELLQITESCTISSLNKNIVSKISVDFDLRKLWLNLRIFIIGWRTRWLNCVVTFI